MDSVIEKFNVFDFLNLIIAGFVFLITLGLCHYTQVGLLAFELAKTIGDSDFLLIIVIVSILCISFVLGLFFQVMGHFIIKEKIGWEKKMIRTCLRNKKLFDNDTRFIRIQNKARLYLQMSDDEKFTKKQSEAFFSYCTYYVQIKGMNNKIEKLFETQGLSQLLVCVFFTTPLVSIILYIVQWKCVCCSLGMDLILLFFLYIMCFVLAFAFYYRYRISCLNRIKMILSVYEAMV